MWQQLTRSIALRFPPAEDAAFSTHAELTDESFVNPALATAFGNLHGYWCAAGLRRANQLRHGALRLCRLCCCAERPHTRASCAAAPTPCASWPRCCRRPEKLGAIAYFETMHVLICPRHCPDRGRGSPMSAQ